MVKYYYYYIAMINHHILIVHSGRSRSSHARHDACGSQAQSHPLGQCQGIFGELGLGICLVPQKTKNMFGEHEKKTA